MPLLCKNGIIIFSTTEVFAAPRACLTGCAPTLSSLSLQSHLLAPCCWYQAIIQSGLLWLVPGCHTEWVAVAGTRLSLIQNGLLLLVPGYHTEWVAVAGIRLSYRVGCCCWYQAVIQSGLLLLVPACHTERVAVAGTSLSYRICCCCWY